MYRHSCPVRHRDVGPFLREETKPETRASAAAHEYEPGLTYRCQDTPSGIPSFKSKYAEIRLEAYYSLISIRKAATYTAPLLWTCNGGVEVHFRAVWA